MSKPRVYIETTIPSFYYETRPEADMVARHGWTRSWWDNERAKYELVTSDAVIEELENGNFPMQQQALSLLADLPLLEIDRPIADIVATDAAHHVMPVDPSGDAMHLALASFHRCDFLLTWNCRHLANANKFAHFRRINSMLGLFIPTLVTPLELLGEET